MKDRKARKREQEKRKEQYRTQTVRRLVPLTVVGAEPRPCGDCQACCEVVAVHVDVPQDGPEDKPNYQRCRHQCEVGCAIYADRPKECRTYHCMYSKGFLTGGEEMRPDNLGVLIDFRDDHGEDVLVLWETRPGAIDEPPVQRLIQRLRAIRASKPLGLRWNEYGEAGIPGEKPGEPSTIAQVRKL